MKWNFEYVKNKFNLSILTKLVFSFLIVIIPLYVVTLAMNRIGYEQNEREISKSLSLKLQTYLDTLEYEIQRLSDLQLDYVVDSDLLLLSSAGVELTDYERNHAVQNLQKRLQIMKSSSVYIEDTSIYIPLINRTINTFKFQTEVNAEEFVQFQSKLGSNAIVFLDNRLFLSLPYQGLPSGGEKKTDFIVVIEISTDQMKKSMNAALTVEGGGALLSYTHQDEIIVNDANEGDLPALKTSILTQQQSGTNSYIGLVSSQNQKLLTAVEYSPYLDITLVAYVPQDKIMAPLRQYESWFLFFSILSIMVIIVFSLWIYRQVHRPLVKLVFAFRKVEEGDFTPVIRHKSRDEFGYLYKAFDNMVKRLTILISEVYEQKIKIQQSELKRLQAQINPHFLFNNHFILARLIKYQDYENAERFAAYMGEYLQFITRDAQNEISMEQEVKHAKTYVEIQTFCFDSRVEVQFDTLPAWMNQLLVPRFILQPIIENSYKYVFENKLSEGILRIGFMLNNGQVIVHIEDNGDEMDESQLEFLNRRLSTQGKDVLMETTGLINIHQRIQIKLGPASGLYFSKSELGGLKVEVRLHEIETGTGGVTDV